MFGGSGLWLVRRIGVRVGVGRAGVSSRPRLPSRAHQFASTQRGPKTSAAYTSDGTPTRALEGFLNAQQATAADLTRTEANGIEYVAMGFGPALGLPWPPRSRRTPAVVCCSG
ncbi:glycine--tRNA ligase subunit beta [Nocardia vaccinii]|uniref:glycine--tRNA ligase subunit beta n=1 Tax=Nocardia vaccinii TaxID=1822 RepID=UPI0035A2437B